MKYLAVVLLVVFAVPAFAGCDDAYLDCVSGAERAFQDCVIGCAPGGGCMGTCWWARIDGYRQCNWDHCDDSTWYRIPGLEIAQAIGAV